MITFKSPQDLTMLNSNDPAYPVVKELVDVLEGCFAGSFRMRIWLHRRNLYIVVPKPGPLGAG